MATASAHILAIGAKKMLGTGVKDPSGKSIGKLHDLMLDKESNNIMYAVVGFGGFLGMGAKYRYVSWPELKYDGDGAYVVPFTKDQLIAGPADSVVASTRANGAGYRDPAHEYYRVQW
ncbi:MAG TPA: PRC-barrel domain-containing protein [Steroidobacteraceae bacterium]